MLGPAVVAGLSHQASAGHSRVAAGGLGGGCGQRRVPRARLVVAVLLLSHPGVDLFFEFRHCGEMGVGQGVGIPECEIAEDADTCLFLNYIGLRSSRYWSPVDIGHPPTCACPARLYPGLCPPYPAPACSRSASVG